MTKALVAEPITAKRIIDLYRACKDDNLVASSLNITQIELDRIKGLVAQDNPEFFALIEHAKHYRKAKALETTLGAIEDGDIAQSRWELERTHEDYNPKVDITSNKEPIKGFTIIAPNSNGG